MKPDWPRPWRSLFEEGEAEFIAAQLQRELMPGHPLYGKSVTPLARRDDTNDILFALSDGRVAQVHLTWKTGPFTVELPWAVTFACIDDFLGEVREHLGDNITGSVFVDTDHPANRLALTALSNPIEPLFKLPGAVGDETGSIDGPPGEHRHRVWHELGSRLPADSRCLIYNHEALISLSSVIIAVVWNSGYALRAPHDVIGWATESIVRALGENAREDQANIVATFGDDWLLGAYLDQEIGWCRQMYTHAI